MIRRSRVRGSRAAFFCEEYHEIFSTVFKKGSYQFLAKECAQVLVNRLENNACMGKVLDKLTTLNRALMG